MEEEKKLFTMLEEDAYDAADRPFDFVGMGSETAMVCEADPALRGTITAALEEMGYQVTAPASAKEALRSMRFHVFNVAIINELFDAESLDGNEVVEYLAHLAMGTRRQIFVVMTSDQYRTMDNMAAFNRSVNLIINRKNLGDCATILKRGLEDHTAFYHVFNESLKKMGRL